MSKPNLPDLPYSLLESLNGEEINEVRAYAEESVRQALAAQVPVADVREALVNLLAHVDRSTCTHENLHKAGTIWTICDDCDRKWSSDMHPFKPHEDAPAGDQET